MSWVDNWRFKSCWFRYYIVMVNQRRRSVCCCRYLARTDQSGPRQLCKIDEQKLISCSRDCWTALKHALYFVSTRFGATNISGEARSVISFQRKLNQQSCSNPGRIFPRTCPTWWPHHVLHGLMHRSRNASRRWWCTVATVALLTRVRAWMCQCTSWFICVSLDGETECDIDTCTTPVAYPGGFSGCPETPLRPWFF